MSYILDSLKKSDKERRLIDTPAAMVMSAPAFLANEKPKTNYRLWVITFFIVSLLLSVYFITVNLNKFSDSYFNNNSSDAGDLVTSALAENTTMSQEKEAAIQLYKQALTTKSRPEIDSLYKELNEKKSIELALKTVSSQTISSSVDSNIKAVVTSVAALDIVSTLESSPVSALDTSTIETRAPVEPLILSIYELDSYVRKNIPSVDYGAHIYATDNNSGFVILDGARRRAGDQLDSGLYIEKIEEESVILSFNGMLFSLPAMKSWQGR
jgi:hypothetical protein